MSISPIGAPFIVENPESKEDDEELESTATESKIQQLLESLSNGFKLSEGKLQYTHSFSKVKSNFKVIVVLHPETGVTKEKTGFYDKNRDAPINALTPDGVKQAQEIANSLKQDVAGHSLMVAYADNTRTEQMAEIFQKTFDNIDISRRLLWLNEFNLDHFSGKSRQDVVSTDDYYKATFLESSCIATCPEADYFLDFLKKVYVGLKGLQETDLKEDSIIILCTSRVTLTALKILQPTDIVKNVGGTTINWPGMAAKLKPGLVFSWGG